MFTPFARHGVFLLDAAVQNVSNSLRRGGVTFASRIPYHRREIRLQLQRSGRRGFRALPDRPNNKGLVWVPRQPGHTRVFLRSIGPVFGKSFLTSNSLPGDRQFHIHSAMAKSKFEYVRQFETEDRLMPNCWIVVRIDGKSFHRFTNAHHYMKPNDERGLGLMTRAAQNVLEDFKDIMLAYGQSDEYSFVFHKHTNIYNRRGTKIMTNVVSLFSSSFTMLWPRYFSTQDLQYAPAFDARVVLYPSDQNLRDYLSWRQADCHINNLYNTCFWKLVQERGMSPAQAQERLKGTLSSDKNELLYSDFKINYNNLSELFRKGTILIRCKDEETSETRTGNVTSMNNHVTGKGRPSSVVLHTDLIGKQFWEDHPDILSAKK